MLLRIPFAIATFLLLGAQGALAADAAFTKQALAAAQAIKAGRHDEALATLDALIKRYPRETDLDLVYWLTCKAYSGKANYSAAIVYCSAAILRNPRNANFYADRGRAHYLRDETNEARADLEAAEVKGAGRADVHGLLARLYFDAGETAKAGSEVAKALKLNKREKNALAVRTALGKAKPAPKEDYPDVRPMPRVPPPVKPPAKEEGQVAAKVAAAKPAPTASSARTAAAETARATETAPARSAPARSAPTQATPTQAAPTQAAPIQAAPVRPQAPAYPVDDAAPRFDAPPWWHNTPPVPAFRTARRARSPLSIDCAQAEIPAERMICADAVLRRQDISMNRLVSQVMAVAANQESVAEDQRAWEAERRNACVSRRCLYQAYAERRLELLLWIGD